MFMVSIMITQCSEVTALDAEHTLMHNTFFIFQQTVVCNGASLQHVDVVATNKTASTEDDCRIERDMIKNFYWSSCKVYILVRF